MEPISRKIVENGLFNVLKPLTRLLLACGFGFKEFTEISKKAFVSVATSDHGLRGRPTNISRVAVMTGLTRKEVRRIRNLLETPEEEISLKRSPANKVLGAWYSDPDFCDNVGRPRKLAQDGESGSFTALVRNYGGDIPPIALLRELERGGAVQVEDGGVIPLTRFFEPTPMDDEYLSSSFFSISNIISTIVHNTLVDRSKEGYAERYVFSSNLTLTASEQFREMIEEGSIIYLESLDDWLVGHESVSAKSEELVADDPATVGFGVYFFRQPKK